MLPDFTIENGRIVLAEPPKKQKKITGTRFASILGLNPWQTEFQVWCEITGFYKEPFEENIYTKAGKVIEPIIIDYLDKRYFFGKNKVKTPEQWFGKTVQQMRYDHYPNEEILGGMWDARAVINDIRTYEIKTTKRAEDWYKKGKLDAPGYYKMQGALYTYLDGLDAFSLVLTVLEDKDYTDPEKFKPNTENVFVIPYSLKREYPKFQDSVAEVLNWHGNHILTGISPKFDEKKDKEILKAIRTQKIELAQNESTIEAIFKELEPLQQTLEIQKETNKTIEKRISELKEEVKKELKNMMKDTDKQIVAKGSVFEWTLRLDSGGFDSTNFKKDHPDLYNKYLKKEPIIKLISKFKEAI